MADYVTLAEVKEYLQDLDNSYDTVLQHMITRASRDVDRLTGRFFDLQVGVTRLFDGNGAKALIVPDLNAVTALGVKVGGTWVQNYTNVPATDFFLEPAERRAGHPAQWIELADIPTSLVIVFDLGKRTVTITGDWGWAAIPEDIKEVVIEMVTRSWRQRGAGDDEQAGINGLDVSNVPRGLSRRSIEILEDYGYRTLRFA